MTVCMHYGIMERNQIHIGLLALLLSLRHKNDHKPPPRGENARRFVVNYEQQRMKRTMVRLCAIRDYTVWPSYDA